MPNCSSFFESETEFECTNNELTCESISSIHTNTENDDEQLKENSICSNKDLFNNGFYLLKTPSVLPRRIHQTSECSKQICVRYVLFDPSLIKVVRQRRRRIIESIYLHVQQKKNIFEKFIHLFNGIKSSTIYELGLQFLYVYNGLFNYRQGHTFVMFFRRNIWYLTIDKIKYIDCQLDEHGPQSTLILNYKNQITSVQV
ncbi:unnamed protein product [Rotaria sordida]|uniref:Uncharacterized protein n=2 Tax=Rotaria sordida TaxID=392033 RepID=A0A815CBK7_9BILA|nr:unnamed protein product [Rotaria sordida]